MRTDKNSYRARHTGKAVRRTEASGFYFFLSWVGGSSHFWRTTGPPESHKTVGWGALKLFQDIRQRQSTRTREANASRQENTGWRNNRDPCCAEQEICGANDRHQKNRFAALVVGSGCDPVGGPLHQVEGSEGGYIRRRFGVTLGWAVRTNGSSGESVSNLPPTFSLGSKTLQGSLASRRTKHTLAVNNSPLSHSRLDNREHPAIGKMNGTRERCCLTQTAD